MVEQQRNFYIINVVLQLLNISLNQIIVSLTEMLHYYILCTPMVIEKSRMIRSQGQWRSREVVK